MTLHYLLHKIMADLHGSSTIKEFYLQIDTQLYQLAEAGFQPVTFNINTQNTRVQSLVHQDWTSRKVKSCHKERPSPLRILAPCATLPLLLYTCCQAKKCPSDGTQTRVMSRLACYCLAAFGYTATWGVRQDCDNHKKRDQACFPVLQNPCPGKHSHVAGGAKKHSWAARCQGALAYSSQHSPHCCSGRQKSVQRALGIPLSSRRGPAVLYGKNGACIALTITQAPYLLESMISAWAANGSRAAPKSQPQLYHFI